MKWPPTGRQKVAEFKLVIGAPDMYVSLLHGNRENKAGKPAAESVEGRGGNKRNAELNCNARSGRRVDKPYPRRRAAYVKQ